MQTWLPIKKVTFCLTIQLNNKLCLRTQIYPADTKKQFTVLLKPRKMQITTRCLFFINFLVLIINSEYMFKKLYIFFFPQTTPEMQGPSIIMAFIARCMQIFNAFIAIGLYIALRFIHVRDESSPQIVTLNKVSGYASCALSLIFLMYNLCFEDIVYQKAQSSVLSKW